MQRFGSQKSTYIVPFMPGGLFYLNSLDMFISIQRVSGYFLLLPCFIEIPVLNLNSVDPGQTPPYATSDLGQKCLPMSLFYGKLGTNGLSKHLC